MSDGEARDEIRARLRGRFAHRPGEPSVVDELIAERRGEAPELEALVTELLTDLEAERAKVRNLEALAGEFWENYHDGRCSEGQRCPHKWDGQCFYETPALLVRKGRDAKDES